MHRFSYLLTYRETNENRLNNLRYVLDQLCLDSTLEVVIVEQDTKQRLSLGRWSNIKYAFVENAGSFNKSWGLNIAASMANGNRLIFADSDLLIEAAALDEMSKKMDSGVDALNPYNVLIDLSQQESLDLFEQAGEVRADRTPEQLDRKLMGQYPPFCGGVFAITRDLYNACGGLDERFEGWGGEDDAMTKRLCYFASKMVELNYIAYHLWHEPSKLTTQPSQQYIRNLALLTQYYERQDTFYQSIAESDLTRNACPIKYKPKETEVLPLENRDPLISCLCVTRDRVEQLSRAIKCFQAQRYAAKELVVVCEADDQSTREYCDRLNSDNIKLHIVPSPPKLSLGELRNLSIELATGEFICQWDDDDWYHPTRLERQLNSVLRQNKAASVLPRWLIHQVNDDKVFCSNIRLWEGSLLCRKSALPESAAYDETRKGEDSKLIETLFIEDQIAIEDFPELYVYCSNHNNTWDSGHFKNIIEASVELSPQESAIVKNQISI